MWIWILVMLAVVVLDQVSKLLIEHFMEVGESIPLIDGIFHLTYIHNDGAAFGMLSEHRWVFMILSVVAIVALIVYLFWAKPKSRFVCASLAMIVGGGVGNMIDRVRLNYVIDFLDFCAFPDLWKWIFNVADACVCVGGAILFVACIWSIIADSTKGKKKKAQGGADAPIPAAAVEAEAVPESEATEKPEESAEAPEAPEATESAEEQSK